MGGALPAVGSGRASRTMSVCPPLPPMDLGVRSNLDWWRVMAAFASSAISNETIALRTLEGCFLFLVGIRSTLRTLPAVRAKKLRIASTVASLGRLPTKTLHEWPLDSAPADAARDAVDGRSSADGGG